MRICITGGPKTGKTTLALKTRPHPEVCVLHTDNLIEQCAHLGKDGWSEASRIASTWLDEPGPWIIEGVAASRALRKWREAHPGEPPPVDKVIRLTAPHIALSKGQATMAKGEETVWAELENWLWESGVIEGPPPSLRWARTPTAHALKAQHERSRR